MRKVDLEHMLAARDRRVDIQNNMLEKGGGECCLACLTLNIAGEIKRTPMTKMLFDRGREEFDKLGFDVKKSLVIDEFTGSEAFWLVKEDSAHVKSCLEEIEDAFPAARLFDFDVLASDGAKLSRGQSRRCLICDKPAAECARSRAHGLDVIKEKTQSMLRDFCAKELSQQAHDALLSEVYATPKPGLVDLNNTGAHSDMDVAMFEKSADALKPYFYDAALLGMNGCSMEELRARGLAAEQEMFAATGGVNTHKGMIYSMGLLLAGKGMELAGIDHDEARNVIEDVSAALNREPANNKEIGDTEDAGSELPAGTSNINGEIVGTAGIGQQAIKNAAGLASQDAERMLAKARANPDTNGAAVLINYGALGATGHAAAGFPGAVYAAERLAYYRHIENFADRQAGALALCDSMAYLEDTNLLHRGGPEGLEFAKKRASEICGLDPCDRLQALEELDKEMINNNLSPGGSADMLALAFLLGNWDER